MYEEQLGSFKHAIGQPLSTLHGALTTEGAIYIPGYYNVLLLSYFTLLCIFLRCQNYSSDNDAVVLVSADND